LTTARERKRALPGRMRPFETHCEGCATVTRHQTVLCAFVTTEKGEAIRRYGYCLGCGRKHEKYSLVQLMKKQNHGQRRLMP
jgi:hypothetical protein